MMEMTYTGINSQVKADNQSAKCDGLIKGVVVEFVLVHTPDFVSEKTQLRNVTTTYQYVNNANVGTQLKMTRETCKNGDSKARRPFGL